jgi:hypothetical protein
VDSNFQYAGAVNLIVASLFSPRAFHRVRTAGGLGDRAGGRAVARCRTQADRLILHVATACAEDVADIGAAAQVTHADPQQPALELGKMGLRRLATESSLSAGGR